jgi:hypothetical protein
MTATILFLIRCTPRLVVRVAWLLQELWVGLVEPVAHSQVVRAMVLRVCMLRVVAVPGPQKTGTVQLAFNPAMVGMGWLPVFLGLL